MTCETIESWENGSRKHYGTPNQLFVKPVVRVNGSFDTIPDGHRIAACFVEQTELFQGMAAPRSSLADDADMVVLAVPAGAIVGGTRISAQLGGAITATAAAGTVSVALQVRDSAGTMVNSLTLFTEACINGSKVGIVDISSYFDATANVLRSIMTMNLNGTITNTVLATLAFNPALDRQIALVATASTTANSQQFAGTYGSIAKES